MAAVVIAISHKHAFRFKEQSILTNRTVFANRQPRIGISGWNNDSTAYLCGGRSLPSFYLFLYIFMIFCSNTGLSLNALSVGNGI